MLKYLTKITMDILPSVVATIIGAYIVNHYIATKPATDAPVAAAVAPAAPKKPDAAVADVGNLPTAGIRAKGISEKGLLEKTAAEKPATAEKVEKPAEKPAVAEKSPESTEVETASISPDSRRRPAASREKPAVRVIPLTATAQPTAAPVAAPTVEAAITPEEHRDANDLARAAIERLRGSSEAAPHAPEAARVPDSAPRTTASVPPAAPRQQRGRAACARGCACSRFCAAHHHRFRAAGGSGCPHGGCPRGSPAAAADRGFNAAGRQFWRGADAAHQSRDGAGQ